MVICYILLGIAAAIVIASPIIGIILGLELREKYGSDRDWYLEVVGKCALIGGLLFIASIIIRPFYPAKLYDVEIRAHYVDGYSTVMRKDSIEENFLPEIRNGRYEGIGSLYFAGERHHGVIRFEYLKKREYNVDYMEYLKKKNNN